MKLTIVGTGYVGLVTGVCLADVGHHVRCLDIDKKKIDLLSKGVSPIFEPGIEDLIRRNIEYERLTFSTSLADSLDVDALFIAVGTPEAADGNADLSFVVQIAEDIGRLATRKLLVIVKSTVPVGTGDLVKATIEAELKKRNLVLDISIASNPEFLAEGDAIRNFMRPDRIIVGLDGEKGKDLMQEIYKPFMVSDPTKLHFMDRRSAELCKYAANAMLATRISFMNELARLTERVGASINSVRIGIGTDPRIGKQFLYPGPGYGGSCFPKDTAALLKMGEKYDVNLSILKAVKDVNASQKEYVFEKIFKFFSKSLQGKKVAIWGLAFKPGTDDVRESSSLVMVKNLLAGGATVVAHDPKAGEHFKHELGNPVNFSTVNKAYSALDQADALVLMTEWSEYRSPNWDQLASNMRQKVVFDFRNQWDAVKVKAHGFHYENIGEPS